MAQSLSERAESAREQLFQRYDQLNTLWKQAEEQLTALHVPRGVECYYRSWDDGGEYEPDGYNSHACLGLQKISGKWRICHGYCDDFRPVEHWAAITECSAEIRVEAASHLPKLREAVVKSAEDFVPKVDDAINSLYQTLMANLMGREELSPRAKLNGKAK